MGRMNGADIVISITATADDAEFSTELICVRELLTTRNIIDSAILEDV